MAKNNNNDTGTILLYDNMLYDNMVLSCTGKLSERVHSRHPSEGLKEYWRLDALFLLGDKQQVGEDVEIKRLGVGHRRRPEQLRVPRFDMRQCSVLHHVTIAGHQRNGLHPEKHTRAFLRKLRDF